MTISITASTCSFVSDGSNLGPYAIKSGANGIYIDTASEVLVETVTPTGAVTTLALSTNYTISGAGSDAASMTLVAPVTSGHTIRISRVTPITQTLNLSQAGAFSPASIMAALDKSARIDQDQQRKIDGFDARIVAAEEAAFGAEVSATESAASAVAAAAAEDEAAAAAATALAAATAAATAAAAIPLGGTAGQALVKSSDADLDTEWSSPSASVDLAADYTWTGQHTWALGTITTSQPLALTQTWNDAAVTFEGRSVSITDTASGSISYVDIMRVNGTIVSYTTKAGQVYGRTSITTDGGLGEFRFFNRSRIHSPLNGRLLLRNSELTDFGLLQFGGTTNAFPAIKRDGANLRARDAADGGDVAWVGLNTAKAWVSITSTTGAIRSSNGVASVSRPGPGQYILTWTTPFADTNYCAMVTHEDDGNSGIVSRVTAKTTTTCTVVTFNVGASNTDVDVVNVVAFGV